MNIDTSPDIVNRAAVDITPGYMSGFGNSFETEALPGALPRGRAEHPGRYRLQCRRGEAARPQADAQSGGGAGRLRPQGR